jgi:hypothetical protein
MPQPPVANVIPQHITPLAVAAMVSMVSILFMSLILKNDNHFGVDETNGNNRGATNKPIGRDSREPDD